MFIMWATGVEQGCASKVIWAILLTNMGHITDQYGPYYRPIWAILQARPISSHKSHKAYKSYKTYIPYKTYKPYKSYNPL